MSPAMKPKWQNGGFARSLCLGPFILYTCDVILQSLQTQEQCSLPAAVFGIVTQRMWEGALRDDTKNGCKGD